MISRDTFLNTLVNFSSSERPLDARYFRDKYGSHDEKLDKYQRQLPIYRNEIIDGQLAMAHISAPKYIICSSSKGYFVARTRAEAEEGLKFYSKRMEEIGKIRNKFKRLIDLAFPLPEQADMFGGTV